MTWTICNCRYFSSLFYFDCSLKSGASVQKKICDEKEKSKCKISFLNKKLVENQDKGFIWQTKSKLKLCPITLNNKQRTSTRLYVSENTTCCSWRKVHANTIPKIIRHSSSRAAQSTSYYPPLTNHCEGRRMRRGWKETKWGWGWEDIPLSKPRQPELDCFLLPHQKKKRGKWLRAPTRQHFTHYHRFQSTFGWHLSFLNLQITSLRKSWNPQFSTNCCFYLCQKACGEDYRFIVRGCASVRCCSNLVLWINELAIQMWY